MQGLGQIAAAVAVDASPRAADGRILINTRGILEWAFGAECASIDFDEIGQIGPRGYGHLSATAKVADIGGLGVRVDVSGGRSYPHDDADLIASVVRSTLDWGDAVTIAELARAGRTPQWDLPPTACVPCDWKDGAGAARVAKTEALPRQSFRRDGRLVQFTPVICPVHFTPTAGQIGAARRAYLQWVANLTHLRPCLKAHEYQRFVLTDALPELRPWKKAVD
ncbi:hypothetical protein [uncultured Tateyamaria sp.]|uniref:hypothetical protein n=1 Tax=uncultured Tateyamaria sp. TaxID=455651 RepID=UPI00262FC6EF|nr:hypothetical protein [uncultured Tateyamaria sp.]